MKNGFHHVAADVDSYRCRLPIVNCRLSFEPRHLGCYTILLCFVVCALFAANFLAADVASDFSAANELYAKGKFAEAAAIYENILQTGGQSPALLFNDGNAEFKAGHPGKAIAAYRRAELLAPRDAELRANLAFVRNQVQGATLRESRWQNWIGTLTLNEGAMLTAVFFWADVCLAGRAANPARARAEAAERDAPGRGADDFFRRGAGVAGGESF